MHNPRYTIRRVSKAFLYRLKCTQPDSKITRCGEDADKKTLCPRSGPTAEESCDSVWEFLQQTLEVDTEDNEASSGEASAELMISLVHGGSIGRPLCQPLCVCVCRYAPVAS